jgi:hypothetical protein
MSTTQKTGHTAAERVDILPELSFDMLSGRPENETLGKTHFPVNILPPLPFEMLMEPVLRLTISFCPEAEAAQIAGDCHRLYVLLNEHDLAHGGAGLRPIDCASEANLADGQVQLAFRSANPNNAAQRMKSAIGAIENAAKQLPTFRECRVRIAA